jgi:hypothetical protein
MGSRDINGPITKKDLQSKWNPNKANCSHTRGLTGADMMVTTATRHSSRDFAPKHNRDAKNMMNCALLGILRGVWDGDLRGTFVSHYFFIHNTMFGSFLPPSPCLLPFPHCFTLFSWETQPLQRPCIFQLIFNWVVISWNCGKMHIRCNL